LADYPIRSDDMAEQDTRRASGGGTSGTGEPTSTPESGTGDGWAQTPQGEPGSLAGGDDSVEAATGGGERPAGTGSSAAQSGRPTSEGNAPATAAPDPGDPGGMGGVRASSATPHDRPPGGLSPVDGKEAEKHES
jgi:hypothetical protein